MIYAEGDGQLDYVQREVYAGSERIEQFTDRSNSGYERTLYVHEDVQGNTRYYTKTNGNSFAELTYDAWGMPVSPNKLLNNDHGNYVYATYTGHIFDTTLDIYFAEARFYDAQTRTWLAMDPIKDGCNWYQYVYSNPIIYFDPNGLEVWGFGVEVSGTLGVRGAVGVQFVFDYHKNIGIAAYVSAGSGLPADIGIVGTVSYTPDADSIFDLAGMSSGVGGSIQFPIFSAGFDVTFAPASDGSLLTQYTLSFGAGISPMPLEMHGGIVQEKVVSFAQMAEFIKDFIWNNFGGPVTEAIYSTYIEPYFDMFGCH